MPATERSDEPRYTYYVPWWMRLLSAVAAVLAAPAVPLWMGSRPTMPEDPTYWDYEWQLIFILITFGMVTLIGALCVVALWPNGKVKSHPQVEVESSDPYAVDPDWP